MTSRVKRAMDYLKGTRDAWAPTIARFPSIDLEQLVNDLRLPERAQEIKDAPDREQAIASYAHTITILNADIGRRYTEAQGEFNEADKMYDQRIKESLLGPEAEVRVIAASEECKSDFESQVTEDFIPLGRALQDVRDLNKEYFCFRERHKLKHRAPGVTSPAESTAGLWWIAAVVLLETIANGIFFSEGSPAGLIGGFSEAIFLSVLNIALASVIGLFCLRYINHVNPLWKITASLSLLIVIVLVLGLNLLIAHYREAFALAEGAAVRFDLVLQRLQAEAFSMQQPKSWLLGALGLVFNAFASYKFFQLYDPYPGYTHLAYRRNKVLNKLAESARDSLANLNAHRNHSIDQMESIVDLIEKNRSELELATRGRKRLIEEYTEYMKNLSKTAEALTARLIMLSEIEQQTDPDQLPTIKISQTDPMPDPAHYSTEIHERLAEMMKEAISQIAAKYTQESNSVRNKLDSAGAIA